MTRLVRNTSLVVWCLISVSCFGQSASTSSSAGRSGAGSASAGSAGQPGDASAATPADTKKKKVWTNDDVGSLNGPVSVVGGNAKNGSRTTASGTGTADPQYIADTKKQLQKLQSQLDDTNKQLTALKDFSQGKAPEPAGYQIGKGYGRIPVDQQIASLEEKKKDLAGKIDVLLDEARKKGVQPGQLR